MLSCSTPELAAFLLGGINTQLFYPRVDCISETLYLVIFNHPIPELASSPLGNVLFSHSTAKLSACLLGGVILSCSTPKMSAFLWGVNTQLFLAVPP